MYDLIILGGGPAGLTAAVYALRKRLDVLLISPDLGGKTNYHLQIPHVDQHLVINGQEVVNRFANEIGYLEFARLNDTVEKVEHAPGGYRVVTRGGVSHATRALIVASGAHAKRLNVPGEREYLMRGLCYSAVSYAPLFIDRDTIVVGDRQIALRATAELAQIARHVTLVAPEYGDLDSPMAVRLRELANVTILEGYWPERVRGEQFAQSLLVTKPGVTREIFADAIFVELGLIPNSEAVADLVACDEHGHIEVDARNCTSAPGIFAAGDVTNVHAEQVLVAIGEGAKAALSAYEYLLGLPTEEAQLEIPEPVEWR